MNASKGFAVGVAICFQACTSDTFTTPDVIAVAALPVSPTKVEGIVGTIAPFSPTIRVVDAHTGQPVPNASVHFGNDFVSYPSTVTDANGIATAGEWRFSSRAGADTLTARVKGLLVTFTATLTHDVATEIQFSDGGELVALAGSRVWGFGLRVADQFGNGVSGVPLTFSSGSGTLATTTAISGNDGAASTGHWLLDTQPGTSELTVRAAGLKTVILRAQGLDSAALSWYDLQEIRLPGGGSTTSTSSARWRFGITSFDSCLCGEQRGFFVDATYPTNPEGSQSGGRFDLVGSDLKLSSLTSRVKAYVKGDKVFIERIHYTGWLSYEIWTWVYAPSASSSLVHQGEGATLFSDGAPTQNSSR